MYTIAGRKKAEAWTVTWRTCRSKTYQSCTKEKGIIWYFSTKS